MRNYTTYLFFCKVFLCTESGGGSDLGNWFPLLTARTLPSSSYWAALHEEQISQFSDLVPHQLALLRCAWWGAHVPGCASASWYSWSLCGPCWGPMAIGYHRAMPAVAEGHHLPCIKAFLHWRPCADNLIFLNFNPCPVSVAKPLSVDPGTKRLLVLPQ